MIEAMILIAFFFAYIAFNFIREKGLWYFFGLLSLAFSFYIILISSTSISIYWNNTAPYNLTEGMNLGDMSVMLSSWYFLIFIIFVIISFIISIAGGWKKK